MTGGIASNLLSVYSRFSLNNLAVIAPECPGSQEFDAKQSYCAERIALHNSLRGLRGLEYMARTYQRARRLVRNNPQVVIHCSHIHAAFAARRLKRRSGTRYLVWTYALEIMDNLLARPIRSALSDADLVLTISEHTRDFLLSLGIPKARIAMVRPATSAERFRPGLGAHALVASLGLEGKRVLLTMGTLNRRYRYKGQDMVIRALPGVIRHFPDVVYLIAGAGDDGAYLERIARECGVAAHVRLLGRMPEEQIPLLYNCCDIFLLCSREEKTLRGTLVEGFGIVLVEASASGRPVIAGNSGGVPSAVRDGVTGLLVDPTSPASIRDAILRLLYDADLRRELGANGRLWVEREMNVQREAEEFRQAYNNAFPDCPITC